MKTKVCTICKKEKAISEFYFRKDNDSYRNECKSCRIVLGNRYYIKNRRKILKYRTLYRFKNKLKILLRTIKTRCENAKVINYKWYGKKGIKCLLSLDDLKFLWKRDKAYLMKRPSIDRIDNDGNYTLENCRFIELSENIRLGSQKTILQYDLKGNFIKEWISVTTASIGIKSSIENIVGCANGRQKTAKGFIWKYK